MKNSWKVNALAGVLSATVAMFAATPQSLAQPRSTLPPPLSVTKAQFFKSNPAAWKSFLAKLPHRSSAAVGTRYVHRDGGAGGTWTAVTAVDPSIGLCNPILLTDGSVMMPNCGTPDWYKLTPDINGNYANGTWTQLASLPSINGTQYAPLYHSTAVLPDGRVIIMGGEYNNFVPVWTNMGAIYDPRSNTWSSVLPPTGSSWNLIGDAESVVLANGTYMQASCCAYPDADALLNANTLTWTSTGAPSAAGAYQDEQGYTLLQDGTVLTLDIWTNYPNGNANNAERYNPATGTWSSAGNTPVSLVDPIQCGNFEIGPAIVRGNGQVVAFGGNTGCVAGHTSDPTAIYSPTKNLWGPGPTVPAVCGGLDCDLADAPAALLPNGNILFAASPGYGNSPTHFFELTTTNTIVQVSDPLLYADSSGAYYYNFVVLPSGQILSTDFSNVAEIYTPAFSSSSFAAAPVIHSVPGTIHVGATYQITGTQFNGRSQGAAYGDDTQTATNYPIVQITNTFSGHVFYARTSDISSMSIAPHAPGKAHFTAPAVMEFGACTLVVIADGIASLPKSILCEP